MADPEIINIPEWTWVKIATTIKEVYFTRKNTNVKYYKTHRMTKEPAPPVPTLGEIPEEAVILFELSATESIKSDLSIDVYIMCANCDSDADDTGQIIVLTTVNSFDINIQDQSSELISVFLGQMISTLIVLANTAKNDVLINIETTGATPLIGDFVCLQEDTKITQLEVTTVTPIAGNQYTLGLSVPLDYAYTVLSGCMLLDVDMDKDGSITPIEFQVQPKAGTRWDITRMMTSMVMGSAGDDGLFGNLPAITNGVYFRKEDSAESNNLFNAKENSDFAIEGYDVAYPVRSGGGGSHGMRSRITWGGQNKQGVVIRLDGDTNDAFVAVVRDNLTGLNKFRVKVQGHVVED